MVQPRDIGEGEGDAQHHREAQSEPQLEQIQLQEMFGPHGGRLLGDPPALFQPVQGEVFHLNQSCPQRRQKAWQGVLGLGRREIHLLQQCIQLPDEVLVVLEVCRVVDLLKEGRQGSAVGLIRWGEAIPLMGETLGEVVEPLEEEQEQIVDLAVAVGQIGVAAGVIDHLAHTGHQLAQGCLLLGDILPPGQFFQLQGQVAQPPVNQGVMGLAVLVPAVESQGQVDHHQPVDQCDDPGG